MTEDFQSGWLEGIEEPCNFITLGESSFDRDQPVPGRADNDDARQRWIHNSTTDEIADDFDFVIEHGFGKARIGAKEDRGFHDGIGTR